MKAKRADEGSPGASFLSSSKDKIEVGLDLVLERGARLDLARTMGGHRSGRDGPSMSTPSETDGLDYSFGAVARTAEKRRYPPSDPRNLRSSPELSSPPVSQQSLLRVKRLFSSLRASVSLVKQRRS
jgi:hypothetical protein